MIAAFNSMGTSFSTSKRILLVQSSNFPIEVLFLRDDDIPQSVAGGVADLGIVGENEFVERKEDAEVIKQYKDERFERIDAPEYLGFETLFIGT
jgi:ATP phosphoribosyltransferase